MICPSPVVGVRVRVWVEARHWSKLVQMLNLTAASVKLSVDEAGCQFNWTWPSTNAAAPSSSVVCAAVIRSTGSPPCVVEFDAVPTPSEPADEGSGAFTPMSRAALRCVPADESKWYGSILVVVMASTLAQLARGHQCGYLAYLRKRPV